MITLWKGNVNAWDCDEMGHANVRIYAEKALEGFGNFAGAIEMPHAYRRGSPSTLIPVDQHIRYIREAVSGVPLTMTGCVISYDENSVLLYQEIRHFDGTPAASLRTRLVHAEAKSGKPFAWSTRSRAALDHLIDTPPKETAPRSIEAEGPARPSGEATLSHALKVGAQEIGRGLVPSGHCDIFGRMLPSWFIGRISDSVPNLLHEWRQSLSSGDDGLRVGAAALEYRLVFRKWPRAGDRFVVHTGSAEASQKTHQLIHWVLDPDTGEAYATTHVVATTFDLDKRKIIPMPEQHLKELKRLAPLGLSI